MKRYLLIDDEEIFNFIQSEVISNRDAADEVVSYNSAADALTFLHEKIAKQEPVPDFILLDVRMPEMNGFEFLDAFHQLDQKSVGNIRIYMLSSSLDEKDFQRAMSYPQVKGFKSKPLSDEIINEINA